MLVFLPTALGCPLVGGQDSWSVNPSPINMNPSTLTDVLPFPSVLLGTVPTHLLYKHLPRAAAALLPLLPMSEPSVLLPFQRASLGLIGKSTVLSLGNPVILVVLVPVGCYLPARPWHSVCPLKT